MADLCDYIDNCYVILQYELLWRVSKEEYPNEPDVEQLQKVYAKLQHFKRRCCLTSRTPVILPHIRPTMSAACLNVLDLPETQVPLPCFHNLPCSKEVVRVGSLCYDPPRDQLLDDELRIIFAQVKNLILVKQVNFSAIGTVIPYPTAAVKHLDLDLEDEGAFRVVCHYAPQLASVVVSFNCATSLQMLDRILPPSLKKLHIRSEVENPREDGQKDFKFVHSLALESISTTFDYSFFGNTTTQFKELTLQNATNISMSNVFSAVSYSSLELEVLNLSHTNVLTDQLLALLASRCEFLRVLRADKASSSSATSENVGFSVDVLGQYLRSHCSRHLEVLTLRGHTLISNKLFGHDFTCIQYLAMLDLRDTSCSTEDEIEHLRLQKQLLSTRSPVHPEYDPQPPSILWIYLNGRVPPCGAKKSTQQEASYGAGTTGTGERDDFVQVLWNVEETLPLEWIIRGPIGVEAREAQLRTFLRTHINLENVSHRVPESSAPHSTSTPIQHNPREALRARRLSTTPEFQPTFVVPQIQRNREPTFVVPQIQRNREPTFVIPQIQPSSGGSTIPRYEATFFRHPHNCYVPPLQLPPNLFKLITGGNAPNGSSQLSATRTTQARPWNAQGDTKPTLLPALNITTCSGAQRDSEKVDIVPGPSPVSRSSDNQMGPTDSSKVSNKPRKIGVDEPDVEGNSRKGGSNRDERVVKPKSESGQDDIEKTA
jgi:hypothetical protein